MKKRSDKDRFRNKRIWCTEEEVALFKGIQQQAKDHNLNLEDVHSGWVKNKESSLYFKNPKFEQVSNEDFESKLIESLKEHSPKYPKIGRAHV